MTFRFASVLLGSCWLTAGAATLKSDLYSIELEATGAFTIQSAGTKPQRFEPRFTVLASSQDPKLQLRWGEWGDPEENHMYNVLSWTTASSAAKVVSKKNSQQHVEDGFDPEADQKQAAGQTQDIFKAAPSKVVRAERWEKKGRQIEWSFPYDPDFTLKATLELPEGKGEPVLLFDFLPTSKKWFSVGYTGAPEISRAQMSEMWQPLIWQEKRFPNQAYLTEAGRCTLPGTMASQDGVVWGVMADSSELPFMPMPTVANSRFGVAVRNAAGNAQPSLFAPILGGLGSEMKPGQPLQFKLRLFVLRGTIPEAYALMARKLYSFTDFRRNEAMGSLNRTLERTVDYAMSDWARFNDDLRGCAYDTDVPGAVKNVSALHPLGVALVMDDETLYRKRALPMIEYLMSREKFLFTVNPEIKGQGASSKLLGPCAPVSELTALYEMSGKKSPVFLRFAEELYHKTRTLNLDAAVRGDIWQNSLALYRATGEKEWLEKAKRGADQYIEKRIETPQVDFKDPASRGMFFWTSYSPNWMELYELYEATKEPKYLKAAREGARRFAQFTWMCPAVPDGEVLVNLDGKAPTYRNSPKLQPIYLPEERVPAWRVSEIGLTCESSPTSKGHRGILLATHGPWMLRLFQATGDTFLHDIGRSAIIGRYTSFPGYHMNTARTTVYEKPDFAHRPYSQLNSTTSLHYNHIWPHAAMLVDYLVADAEMRSKGAIKFPSRFAEGYAYLQQRIYGDQPGVFYDVKDVWLWMPKGLLRFHHPEINYVAGRSEDTLCLALMNQSGEAISARLSLDSGLVSAPSGKCRVMVRSERNAAKRETIDPSNFTITIAPKGTVTMTLQGVKISPRFQMRLAGSGASWKKDFAEMDLGGGRAMLMNMGPDLKSAYVYLQADGTKVKQATLRYRTPSMGNDWKSFTDPAFPFDFTAPLSREDRQVEIVVECVDPEGKTVRSTPVTLHES